MRTLRISLKYFTVGLVAGLLLAPRAGRDTRRHLVDQTSARVQELLNAVE